MKTYMGGCHCKAVRFEVETDLAKVIECNCSYCYMKGFVLTFVPATQFKLISGEENQTEYLFNTKHISHLFCKTCGTQSFGRGKMKDGTPTVAINVRCLEGVDMKELTIAPVDGKSF